MEALVVFDLKTIESNLIKTSILDKIRPWCCLLLSSFQPYSGPLEKYDIITHSHLEQALFESKIFFRSKHGKNPEICLYISSKEEITTCRGCSFVYIRPDVFTQTFDP